MPIVAKRPETHFTPPPEGLHVGVCCDVVELGTEVNKFNGGLQEKVRLIWQLEDANPETGKRFEVSGKYTLSLHEKANLRRDLESWRGRKFSKEEEEGFDLEKLIGVPCQLQVIHHVTDMGKTYANVQAVVPIGKGMTKPRVSEDYVRVKDRKPTTPSGAHFEAGDDEVPF